MTIRASNNVFLSVIDAIPLAGVGWEVRIYDQNNFNLLLATVPRWQSLKAQRILSDVGMGEMTLDLEDAVWDTPVPGGSSLRAKENLVKFYYNGYLRWVWFMEDFKEGYVNDSETRTITISGRGPAKVLEWATVLPPGYPAQDPKKMDHDFGAAPAFNAWKSLLAEAQARGVATFVYTLFTTVFDTEGVSWVDAGTLLVKPGGDLLELLTAFGNSVDADWIMSNDFGLDVRRNYGTHRENFVRFQVGADQLVNEAMRTRRPIRNTVYAEGSEGSITQVQDAASVAQWRKRETYVEAGQSASSASRNQYARAALNFNKEEKHQVTVKVPLESNTRSLWLDYDLGDWVGVDSLIPSAAGNHRVISWNVDVNAAGETDLELTLHTLIEETLIHLQRLMQKITNTTTTVLPEPIDPPSNIGDLNDVDIPDDAEPGDGLGLDENGDITTIPGEREFWWSMGNAETLVTLGESAFWSPMVSDINGVAFKCTLRTPGETQTTVEIHMTASGEGDLAGTCTIPAGEYAADIELPSAGTEGGHAWVKTTEAGLGARGLAAGLMYRLI